MADGEQAWGHYPQSQAAFRASVDAFLERELTDALRAAGRATIGMHSDPEACRVWWRKLRRKGWIAPTWPVEHGGAGWSPAQRLYFENACAAQDAPILFSSGLRTIGPLILQDGTPDQVARYIRPILDQEHVWCQGFSEPQAGSDLAALSLRASRDRGEFVLNGSKVWTSMAHEATHMFLLARTEAGSSGRDGITFFLMDMKTPGVTVRPIRTIDGLSEVNEVWFEGARIPASNRIGEIDQGWRVAKRLMAIARGNNTTTGLLRRSLRAARRGLAEAGDDRAVQRRLAALDMKVDGLESLECRVASGTMPISDAAAASVVKLVATELHQLITEAGLAAAPSQDFAQARYFSMRAASIYSGTSEIHRNILAHAIGTP